MPQEAALPVAVMMATGVARPKAQGQEMTSTLMANVTQCSELKPPSTRIQTRKVTRAMSTTTGTKMPATLSANCCRGALLVPASRTILTIFERVVSSPTLSAFMRMTPEVTRDADVTSSPSCSSTGRLSPVIALLSTAHVPSTITPSTGMYSPCLTMMMSPSTTMLTAIIFSSPSRTARTVSGVSLRSFSTASPVFFLDSSSSHLPRSTKASIMAADSKCRSMAYSVHAAWDALYEPMKTRMVRTREYMKDTPEPRHTRVSMLGTFLKAAFTPRVKYS